MSKRIAISFIIILLSLSVSSAQHETSDVTLSPSITIHDEYNEFAIDSFSIKRWKDIDVDYFKQHNVSEHCFTLVTKDRQFIWDYRIYVDDALENTIPFIEPEKYIKTCFPIPQNRSKVTLFESYKLNVGSKPVFSSNFINISKPFLFPFDSYGFDIGVGRAEGYLVYSAKFTFPRSFEAEYNESSIIGDYRIGVGQIYYINNTPIKMTPFAYFYANMTKPNFQSFEGDNKVVIFPLTMLLGQNESVGDRKELTAHLTIKRTSLDMTFFIVFLISFILITCLYITKRISLEKLIESSLLVWIGQEGLYQLMPTIRPNMITIFDLTIVIVVVIPVVIYEIFKKIKKEQPWDYVT